MLLEVDMVSRRFGGLLALSDVTFAITEGEVAGLIGPNGAGKTTMFNLIAGTIPPTSGAIRFADCDVSGFPPHRMCTAGVARTFQIVRPFGNLSVFENVLIGAFAATKRRTEAERRVTDVLEQTGLLNYRGVPARSLPLGLRKRVEVARALATRPKLLLLDEVMNGLNPGELVGIMEMIRTLNATGITILLIEHVMTAVMALCSRVIVFNHGVKIAEGPPDAIVSDEAVIEAYLGQEYKIA